MAAKPPVLLLVGAWLVLVAGGIGGTVWYTGKLKSDITADVQAQADRQIAALKTDYESRIGQMEAKYTTQITGLSGKVDALNELLTFTKDNAGTKTDNSNKLYTQINEVKRQLDELEKTLELLK